MKAATPSTRRPARKAQPPPFTPRLTPAQIDRHVRESSRTRARLLIALRKHLGLSEREVAARAGISPSTVLTQEAASPYCAFADFIRLCSLGLGFDCILVMFEGQRRLRAEGTPDLHDDKPWSEARIIKKRCAPGAGLKPAEARRQLRIMKSLTLPRRPGPPARKRRSVSRAR